MGLRWQNYSPQGADGRNGISQGAPLRRHAPYWLKGRLKMCKTVLAAPKLRFQTAFCLFLRIFRFVRRNQGGGFVFFGFFQQVAVDLFAGFHAEFV